MGTETHFRGGEMTQESQQLRKRISDVQ